MEQQADLVTAASLIAGFGSTLMVFRLERELNVEERNLNVEERNRDRSEQEKERHWFPASDWLIVISNVTTLCLVVAPLVSIERPSQHLIRFASAVCSAAAIMLAGYIPSILAHYHFFYGLERTRTNPTF
jgi:hypothetical protein